MKSEEMSEETRRDAVKASSPAAAAPPFLPLTSTWSLPNGFGEGDLDSGQPLPDAFATHRIGFQSLGDGCGLFDATVLFTEPVKIVTAVTSERPFLLLRLPLAGRVEVSMQGQESVNETPEGYGLFLHGRGGDQCTIMQKSGECSDLVAPMIAVDRLRDMLDGIRIPAVIAKFMDGHDENFVAAPRMSAAIRRLAGQIRASPYTGDLGNLYRQGKLFEVVAGLLGDLGDGGHPRRPVIGCERARIAAVCDLLRLDLAHPPTLESLARGAGLSQRRLGEVFREVTGLTVIEWVLRQKLLLAADLLREGRLPVKEIAHRLGYSQVSTFTAAFSRQFGVAPAGYRRAVVSHHAVTGGGRGE
jgi:AraC-like DNA-binding protein